MSTQETDYIQNECSSYKERYPQLANEAIIISKLKTLRLLRPM